MKSEVDDFASCVKIGRLKKVIMPWHQHLKDKNLILFEFGTGYNLIGIIGENNGLDELCNYTWENDPETVKESGYDYTKDSVEDFMEEVKMGNDGFGFDKDEIVELGGMEEIRKELKL